MSFMVNDQRVGFTEEGYIDKKGMTAAEALDPNTRYNKLPPGMMIDDQVNSDIRPLLLKQVTGLGFSGDGWTGE